MNTSDSTTTPNTNGNLDRICVERPESIQSQPDLDSLGVLLAFAGAAAVAVVLMLALLVYDLCSRPDSAKRNKASFEERLGVTMRGMFVALSDSQIVLGCALTAGLQLNRCGDLFSVYHYNKAGSYVLLSSATHAMSILMLSKWFGLRPWTTGIRFIGLAIFYGWCMYHTTLAMYMPFGKDQDVVFPAKCYLRHCGLANVQNASQRNANGVALLLYGIICIFAALAMIASTTIRTKRCQPVGWIVRVVLGFIVPVVFFVVGFWSWVYSYNGYNPSQIQLKDFAVHKWGFGQLLPVLVVGLVIVTTLESWPPNEQTKQQLREKGLFQLLFPFSTVPSHTNGRPNNGHPDHGRVQYQPFYQHGYPAVHLPFLNGKGKGRSKR